MSDRRPEEGRGGRKDGGEGRREQANEVERSATGEDVPERKIDAP